MHAGAQFQGQLSQSTEALADIFIMRALDSWFLWDIFLDVLYGSRRQRSQEKRAHSDGSRVKAI